jgi:hypothetical protein
MLLGIQDLLTETETFVLQKNSIYGGGMASTVGTTMAGAGLNLNIGP